MKKSRRRSPKAILRLPDLEHAKSAVLNSLASPESRRSYEFAIQNFVHWYCSEPRLALNRIVVTRYRMQLEQLHLAPSTINQLVGSSTGAVTRRLILGLYPGFPPSCPVRSCRGSVSSARHIARSVRISRTTRSCTVRRKVYETFQTGATTETDP